MGGEYLTSGSSADREVHCAGAIGYEGATIDEANDEATLGTAVGEAVESYAKTGAMPNLDAIAQKHGADRDLLGASFFGGKKAWDQIKHWFPGELRTQVRVQGETTKGTADFVDLELDHETAIEAGAPASGAGFIPPRSMAIIDGKLGMSDDQHPTQLKAYARAEVDNYGMPQTGFVLGVEIHYMSQKVFVHHFTQEDLDELRDTLRRQHSRAGRVFVPGDWCKFCPRRHNCEPRGDWLRTAATSLVELMDKSVVPREALGRAFATVKNIERACAAFDRVLKKELQEGPISDGNGGTIHFYDKPVEKITAGAAIGPAALKGLDINIFAEVTKASIKRAIKAEADEVVATGRKYNQAKATRELLAQIKDAGGIVQHTQQRIGVKR